MMKEEVSLLQGFIWLVRIYDPDIIVGWEIQGFSLGLLAERAANLGIGLLREISRLPIDRTDANAIQNVAGGETGNTLFAAARIEAALAESSIIDDEWGRTHGSGIHVSGRIVLNLWRIMRGEIKLGIYTLEAVAEAVLKRKVPLIPWRTLTGWFSSGPGRKRHLCIEYHIDRARLNLQIINQLDLVRGDSKAIIVGVQDFSSSVHG
jgi:DNA polymerase zeta